MWEWAGRIKATWSWAKFAWQLAAFFGLTGLLASIGGSIWAVILGVPTPVALMVGYCTLVGAVYLAMAPLAYRLLANSSANQVTPNLAAKIAPDYKLWGHIERLTVLQAAHLWNERDPSTVVETPDVAAVATLLKDAIKRSEIQVILFGGADSGDYRHAIAFPKDHHGLDKKSLKQFAVKRGYDPIFLRG